MKKSEICDLLLAKVSEVCEVHKESIIQGVKLQSVVDARVLAVQYLRRIGLSADDIAHHLLMRQNIGQEPTLAEIKKKSKSIEKMFDSYSRRCLESYAFCLMSKDIKDWCKEKYKDYYLSWMKEPPK